MNLRELNELVTSRTAKLGDITRQLALAGIAIIWIFKKDIEGQPAIPRDLFTPGIFIVGSLGLDLLQYALASAFWSRYRSIKEKEFKKDWPKRPRKDVYAAKIEELLKIEFEIPGWFNVLQYICFWAKIASIGIAYWYLLRFLYRNIPAY
jgi:hypothetical protein